MNEGPCISVATSTDLQNEVKELDMLILPAAFISVIS